MIDGFLDFYNKQKSPIFDGKGNVTGYNHGYGNVENFDKPIPKDQYTGPGHSMGDDSPGFPDKTFPPGWCPTPDMQILLSDKSQKPAGEIQVGDKVRTAHEEDFTIGNYEVTRVETVDSPIVKLNFEGKSITCSPTHKFYSETNDDWIAAEDLKEGDRVALEDGEITFVNRQQRPDGKVVSITVDDAHTYICEGFLCHNKTLAEDTHPDHPNYDPTDPRNIARNSPQNSENTGNKIDTSNQNNKMANGSGAQQLSDYLNTMGNVRNITPQFRPRSMVDVELDRGGRISPLIAVGQHRDSPHMGYTNDFAGAPSPFLNWASGGAGTLPGPGNIGNTGQQTEEGNIGGQQASGQGSAAGAGNYGGPNINISNVNNPQAVANTGTIQDSTISNPATGTASQTTSDNTNTNTNTNTPVVTPIGGGPTPIGGGPTPIGGGPTPIGGGPTPIAGGDTRFSADFATEQDAKDWLNTYYGANLGRDAQFDDNFSDASTNASYWLNNLATGVEDKASVGSNILLSDEYTGRQTFQGLDNQSTPNEDRLDAWIGPGGALTQSSDASGPGYYQGTGTQAEYETSTGTTLSDRDSQIYQLYSDVFGRNPDQEGFDYWTGSGGAGMSIGDIEASFRAGAEAQGRDQIGGTSISTPPPVASPPPAVSPVTQTADDWLQDFYTEAGLGTVDAGGRSYWEGDLAGGQTKEQIRANILRHRTN